MTNQQKNDSYKCFGGLIWDHKLTKDECRKCASRCSGCLTMAIKHGFLEKEKVQHLLDKGVR